MPKEYIFSSATFGKWKQQARALKRSSQLSHHQALDHVAKAHRFDDWHQVVTEAKLNHVSETAYRSGLVVAYDVKDAMDSWVPDASFVDDSRVYHFCENDIFAWYRRGDDEVDGEERNAIPTDPTEYREEFEEWLMNVYLFRYTGTCLPPTPAKVLPLLHKRCFFGPMFFWYQGRFIDPWRDLAVNNVLDMTGNTEPNI
ncbi:hypothetical protein [Massilia phyllosphaerae]|uniref:hypothetical protein n=1 Tax=Massilia phyllosphaerae TaxID=3106034 RepID=UPI002B1CD6E5|nr:hypothetical protein [Massilia sp. SGZ-792]